MRVGPRCLPVTDCPPALPLALTLAWAVYFGAHLEVPPAPTVAQLAALAGLLRGVQQGDAVCSQGGAGRPCCVEYTAPPPYGMKLGSLPEGTWLVAKEVKVVLIPPVPNRDLPARWGICIRCESVCCGGRECWVNDTRCAVSIVYTTGRHHLIDLTPAPTVAQLAALAGLLRGVELGDELVGEAGTVEEAAAAVDSLWKDDKDNPMQGVLQPTYQEKLELNHAEYLQEIATAGAPLSLIHI